jgi:hypothetical protein
VSADNTKAYFVIFDPFIDGLAGYAVGLGKFKGGHSFIAPCSALLTPAAQSRHWPLTISDREHSRPQAHRFLPTSRSK